MAAGALLIAFAAENRWIGARAQAEARHSGVLEAGDAAPPMKPAPSPEPRRGELVARLRIPRIGLDVFVFEGVGEQTLRRGPGHVPETARPGAPGNCVIAAHRDSFFRPLEKARPGDLVVLESGRSRRTFRLARRAIVEPTDLRPLAPSSGDKLTLLTCYPFAWIGPAPQRLVWEAAPADDDAAAPAAASSGS